jgi:DNA-binding beta-propeller fold protein YncE
MLTEQYKLSSKFGRKGNGDGYFQSPAFVATDSRGHIIVSDSVNHNVQVFNREGKFKVRFGSPGSGPGQLMKPMGVCVDSEDTIFVADSDNHRVEIFTSRGSHVRSLVQGTDKLGEGVRPVNVAMTPRGSIAVLLNGKYFAEVRLYVTGSNSQGAVSVKESATWYLVN